MWAQGACTSLWPLDSVGWRTCGHRGISILVRWEAQGTHGGTGIGVTAASLSSLSPPWVRRGRRSTDERSKWYSGPVLWELLDSVKPPERSVGAQRGKELPEQTPVCPAGGRF